MKKKQLKAKLSLNKMTISRLSGKETLRIKGGNTENNTVCDCDQEECETSEGSFMLVCQTFGCGDNTATRLPSCWNC